MSDPRRLLDSKLPCAPLLRQYLDVTSSRAAARPRPARRPRFAVMGGLAAAFAGIWLVVAADRDVRPGDGFVPVERSRDQASMIPGGPSGSEGSSGSGARAGTGGTAGGTG